MAQIELNDFWTFGAQELVCVGFEDHVCKDGRVVPLARLRGRCAVCGDVFVGKCRPAYDDGKVPFISRRCPEHKQIGVRAGDKNEIRTYRGKIDPTLAPSPVWP